MSLLVQQIRTALAEETGLELAILFGSVARGTERADSDVDLAVAGDDIDRLALAAMLSHATGRDLHVLELGFDRIPLLEELVRDGIVVREGTAGAAARWRSSALATLETDRPWFRRMRDAWLQRVAAKGVLDGE